MSILCASHLKKYYGKDESLVKALDDVNLKVKRGEIHALCGENGAGRQSARTV